MTIDHVRTILDAMEFKENEFQKRLDHEPKTRGGKPNPMIAEFQRELDKIADARIAFKSAKIEWTV